eukprot:c45210_g1_i1 orf=2-187(-)
MPSNLHARSYNPIHSLSLTIMSMLGAFQLITALGDVHRITYTCTGLDVYGSDYIKARKCTEF